MTAPIIGPQTAAPSSSLSGEKPRNQPKRWRGRFVTLLQVSKRTALSNSRLAHCDRVVNALPFCLCSFHHSQSHNLIIHKVAARAGRLVSMLQPCRTSASEEFPFKSDQKFTRDWRGRAVSGDNNPPTDFLSS